MRRIIGTVLRGLVGIWQNFEPVPTILFQAEKLGETTQGQSINFYSIGIGSRKVLFVGGTHGNEVGTVKLVHHFLTWLHGNADAAKSLTIYAIPCLNPDGYALAQRHPDYFNGGRIGRFNGRNVDLNRNYPTKNFQSSSDWNLGKSYQERT